MRTICLNNMAILWWQTAGTSFYSFSKISTSFYGCWNKIKSFGEKKHQAYLWLVLLFFIRPKRHIVYSDLVQSTVAAVWLGRECGRLGGTARINNYAADGRAMPLRTKRATAGAMLHSGVAGFWEHTGRLSPDNLQRYFWKVVWEWG